MKFDYSALTVIVVSVAGSWAGLSVKYDRKLSVLSEKIDSCACSKEEADPTRTDSDILTQVAEATKLSNQSLETSKRVERRLDTETGTKQSNEDSPFTKDGDGWWVAAEGTMFLIPGGIVIGDKNEDCTYGTGVLSVDGGSNSGRNCPSGDSSVTFGYNSKATGYAATVTGGAHNTAGIAYSSISGGVSNTASGIYSAVSGGSHNNASGSESSITGGSENNASGRLSSVLGGWGNKASGSSLVVLGGQENTAEGRFSTVSGGKKNVAVGEASSILGGSLNNVSGKEATVSGGNRNQARGGWASVSGGFRNTSKGKFASVLGGKREVSSEMYGIFPQ